MFHFFISCFFLEYINTGEKKIVLKNHYCPIRLITQSVWQSGHWARCLTHWLIQQLWNEWLHVPQTITHSWRLLAAWQRKQDSDKAVRHIAQTSWATSQLQIPNNHSYHFYFEKKTNSLPTRFQRFRVNGTDDDIVSDVGLLLVLVDCVDIWLFSDILKRKANKNG